MNVAIDNYDDPVSIYLREAASAPLTKDEETALWRQTQNPDTNQAELAKRRLLESRLRLVVDIAARYESSGVSMLDLIQEGNIGLLAALNTFSRGAESDFSEHASACIQRAIADAINNSQSKCEP